MPLLGKQPFVRKKTPPDVKPEEQLFYFKLTHEVFRDYEAFFERVILCNSLVWTCSLTGRPGLTYQEALDSEAQAKKTLCIFPTFLKRPVLYLASLTKRGRLADLCDDVFSFARDRFFIGEEVEAFINNTRKPAKITNVIPPAVKERNENKQVAGVSPAHDKSKSMGPDPVKYSYEVCEIDKPNGSKCIVSAGAVNRKKGSYTRDKSKLFLKQCVLPCDGIWIVKESLKIKYNIQDMKFTDIFNGSLPLFCSTPKKKNTVSYIPVDAVTFPSVNETKGKEEKKNKESGTPKKKEVKKKTEGKELEKDNSYCLLEKPKKSTQSKIPFKKVEGKQAVALPENPEEQKKKLEEEKLKRQEEIKRKLEEAKRKKKEERAKEKEKKQEEKRLLAEFLSEWKKPRDDLQCDDNQDLPVPTSLDCCIPQESFGDAVMILEFLNSFGELLEMKDFFPQGFTLEHLEKALLETDIEGPLNDLIQMLLTVIFRFQEEEEVESDEDSVDNASVKTGELQGEEEDLTFTKAIQAATVAAGWLQVYHGKAEILLELSSYVYGLGGIYPACDHKRIHKRTSLKQMPLDAFTVTEVLRLHLLSSGAQGKTRRNLTLKEDPGLWFHMEEGNILKKLSCVSIFELTTGEKVKILKVLTDQLLTFDVMRDVIEENTVKLRQAKNELKQLHWAFSRKEREEASAKHKKKLIEKAKKKSSYNPAENDAPDLTQKKGAEASNRKQETEASMTSEELEEQEKKTAKEEARRREEFQKKEKELMSSIHQLQETSNLIHLGRDRAYRRFWCFSTIPGLFVEDNDMYVGICQAQPTQYNPLFSQEELPLSFMKNFLQRKTDEKSTSSDKENEASETLKVQQTDGLVKTNKLLGDSNLRVESPKKQLTNCEVRTSDTEAKKVCLWKGANNMLSESLNTVSGSMFGVCTACPDTCSIHNLTIPRTMWSFYTKPEDLDVLITSLNPRGFREGALRENLKTEKVKLAEYISKCPSHKLNKDILPPSQPEVRKSSRLQSNKPSPYADMLPEDALELTLRDMLLEMEEKLFAGSMGSIKVKDRESWKTAIEHRGYDMQCDGLYWGCQKNRSKNEYSETSGNSSMEEEKLSRRSTSPTPTSLSVKNLSCALLQIAQSIEPRYLQPPLGEDEEFKRLKQKALSEISQWKAKQDRRDGEKNGDDDEDDGAGPPMKIPKSPLERWEESLMTSTSISQLFVHLSTLERSVAWSRSVLKAYCRICRRRKNPELMLLCDGCDRGHHIYCLKPVLKEIPSGDWFCQNCKPKEKPPTPRKPRNFFVEDEEEEDSDVSSAEYSKDSNESDYSQESSDDDNEDVCDVCQKGGTLICCDNCPLAYHLGCVDPPLKRVPRGAWSCSKCVTTRPQNKIKMKGSSTGFYQTRSHFHNDCNQDIKTGKKTQDGRPSRAKSLEVPKKRERCSLQYPPASWQAKKYKTTSSLQHESRKRKFDDDGCSGRRSFNSRRGSEELLLDYKACDEILSELCHHPESWPFLRPVSRKEVPDYHTIIKKPMDLGTIRTKLNDMKYHVNKEFLVDVCLVFQNCELYNHRSSEAYQAGLKLSGLFQSLLKKYCMENCQENNCKDESIAKRPRRD
ncbi:bromodomain adjacent to zinc finger domain protein 1A-like isoform X2 [Tachypleus tridentatus]|uniref:bromodomain adjacent to zinc finger domain protein 1A-like isoform X2 n=1 Tax=Tachypleus tridentatus TaxID=6853 RepID=UPI003FD558DB